MNTEHWASLDQYTSFAKEPWGFNRPENRKTSNVLSRATFVEWPNTTSDFSIHRGVAPPGKLANPKQHLPRHVPALVSSRRNFPAAERKRPLSVTANNRDVARGSSIEIENAGNKDTRETARSAAANAINSSCNEKASIRNSADAVTAAYTLRSREKNASQPSRHKKERASVDHPTTTRMSTWSVNNIGFSDVKGEVQKARERENRESYVRAVFSAQEADKPYIAEATHFRYRYPHTLGRIAALSRARNNRAGTAHNHC